MLLLFTSCGNKEVSLGDNEYFVYYINKTGDEIGREVYTSVIPKEKISNTISELLVALSRAGEETKETQVINSTCKVLDFQINDRKLTLNFDVNYSLLSPVDEVLHRAAIVKTLMQIEGIDAIQFNVDARPLTINKKAVGFMKSEDFISSIGADSAMKSTTVSMYFADETGTKLVQVPSIITYDATIPLGQLMINELLKGPEAIEGLKIKGLQRTLPQNVTCNSLTIRDNICYIDFSKEFKELYPGISNEVAIYSVVNLLAELPNVNKVQFTVDGEITSVFGDSLMLEIPFERNFDIVDK